MTAISGKKLPASLNEALEHLREATDEVDPNELGRAEKYRLLARTFVIVADWQKAAPHAVFMKGELERKLKIRRGRASNIYLMLIRLLFRTDSISEKKLSAWATACKYLKDEDFDDEDRSIEDQAFEYLVEHGLEGARRMYAKQKSKTTRRT